MVSNGLSALVDLFFMATDFGPLFLFFFDFFLLGLLSDLAMITVSVCFAGGV